MAHTGLKIGELARRTGLTVRTLHHYDREGLLRPTARTGSGHRLYGARDVQRLQRIVSLKQLGFSLAEIGQCLNRAGFSAREVLARHLAELRKRMALERALCRRMEKILDQMKTTEPVSAEQFLDLLEHLAMVENYYTPEQLKQLEQRHKDLGDEKIRAVEKEWPELMRKVQAHMEAGTDPHDAAVQPLIKRWNELINAFTGGDPGIRESLNKLWKEQGPAMAGKMGMTHDPRVFAYVGKGSRPRE